jgi:hypothetical protein
MHGPATARSKDYLLTLFMVAYIILPDIQASEYRVRQWHFQPDEKEFF